MKVRNIIFLLLISSACQAEFFKWENANGEIVYTDKKPSIKDKPLDLPIQFQRPTQKDKTEVSTQYQTFMVSQPISGEIISNPEKTVQLAIIIEPALIENHFLQVYLDGLAVGDKTKTKTLTLQQVDLGSHYLQVFIVDEAGITIKKSKETHFNLRPDLKKEVDP